MDGQKFDKLTQAFATGTNRRSLLKILGGATVAGVAGVTFSNVQSAFAQAEGDTCNLGTASPCGDTTLVCCATSDTYGSDGAAGVCTSGMTGCQTSDACQSGTEDACGYFNYTYDLNYICCTYGNPGSEGTCVAEDACVVAPPNTGAGTTADTSNWIAPAAAVGAAAALLAYKNRERNVENEA
jgi:hypothetical protein